MEKLSLKSVKSYLTRDEMRVINGGNQTLPTFGRCSCADGKVTSVASCESCGHYCQGQSWICSGA